MKYIINHAKKNVEKWKNRKWYHQRFDGSPYFMHFIAEAEIEKHRERKKGGHFNVHYCFYKNGKADWYIDMEDIERVSNVVIEEGKRGHFFPDDWKDDEEKFFEMIKKIESQNNIKDMSNEELMKFHNEFAEVVLNRNSSSSLIDGFALGTDEMIADMIKNVYENHPIKNKMRFTEVFSILTAPVHRSFINDAELSLYNIALKSDKLSKDEIENLLKEHQKKFFWIRNNYVESFVLDVEYFRERLNDLLKNDIRIIKENYDKLINLPENNRKEKEKMINELNLNDEIKLLIKISEDYTHWQDERKKATMLTMHYGSIILEEIGKRAGIPLNNLKYSTCREVSSIFEKNLSSKELDKRRENGVYYWDINGMEAVSGETADYIRKEILGEEDTDNVNDFRGLSANTGKAIGRVKVLKSATEINKVNEGDIIVAVMTRPDYVPAIKKASAIVTDEGGVTSHAAIISRELGKPCIIGTKIATKVLKDNYLIEVNANHGWIRILEKND